MNGIVAAGTTAGAATAAVMAYAIRWALAEKRILPTVRMLMMLLAGACAAVAFGTWVVMAFGLLRRFGSDNLSDGTAAIIVAFPAVAVLISGIFVAHSLHPKNKPATRDEWAAFILPLAFVMGIGGALGAVGDSLTHGASDMAVNMAAYLVGGAGR
ncbi:hypothetical protein [Actinomadura sp. WMMA1423]|uniref:hypothetical protein n=1 Tax=Actinomadura sp. WMMA1423 TaxID=2591108 RepID=UPI0011464081|nr:hypothetical protein [Actinomadura sp. WMMA1423]